MSELKVKTEVWCRTCGYFRPVSGQNPGKKEEFRERLNLEIPKSVYKNKTPEI